MKITIIGAGMAGLLAGNMLRNHDVSIIEAQKELPNNHSALLRFRSDAVSRELRIPFRKVKVFKAVVASINPVADAISYSLKVLPNSKIELRSIIDLEPVERFIAPPYLIKLMKNGLNIEFDRWLQSTLDGRYDIRFTYNMHDFFNFDGPLISTMPMLKLMDLLHYTGERPKFEWINGGTMSFQIGDCDIFATLYFPRPEDLFYRISITGDRVIAESASTDLFLQVPHAHTVMRYFGLDKRGFSELKFKPQAYAKINRLSEEDRRKADAFMLWASVNHNVYSLGRFATWRAGLLLDDLVKDINRIETWITTGHYQMMKEGMD